MKLYTHICPNCGKSFSNWEPEKNYLCDNCKTIIIQKLVKEWEEKENY